MIENTLKQSTTKEAASTTNAAAVSWDRVAEIAKDLQNSVSEDERYEYGRELLAISQLNTSLFVKLGISNNAFSGQLMPSGIEVLKRGCPPKRAEYA